MKGEGVSVEYLKKTFNDTQSIVYKLMSTFAEATGIDIVLYQSEMDANGNFQGAQGRFKRGEPGTIYIDINAGLNGKHDVGNLAKYTMLRTFAHEFTHFIEKWNPVQYNEFRKVVFDTLRERGENVDDLVEAKQATGLSYDMASREVVAEAMTDILPDTHFVQNLAEKHKSIFQKLMEKLKEFVEDLRSYFNSLGKNRSREANALKEQVGETVRYVENIVKMFDQVAEQAVENYQLTVAAEQTAEFSQEQNRGNSERGERYDLGRNDGDLQTISSGLDGRTNSGKSADGLGQVLSPKEWSALDGEKQQQIINQLDAYTYSSEEAEIVLSLSAKGDISDEDIRREAVTEMARQFYEAMQGDRVLLENDGRFRWLGDMVGLLIEDVQAIQDGTFVADDFWEQEQRRKYQNPNEPKGAREWSVFNRSLANKTSSLKTGQTKRIVISTANHIYLVEATGYMSYDNITKISLKFDRDKVNDIRRRFLNGSDKSRELSDRLAEGFGVHRGRGDWHRADNGYADEARPSDVLDGGESEGDTAGYFDDYYGFGSGEELSEALRGGALVLDDDGNLIQLLDDEVQEQRRDYIDEGYATDSTNWAYENFIIDETDRARFYEVIADINKRNYSVPRNKNGVYMIEHENKIMFTNGDFKAPTLSKVIVFDTNYDANMAYAKGLIFDEERRTAGHGEALRAIEDLFGEGYVSEYNSKIYKPDAWKNRGREREDGRGIDQEVQDQERTSPLTDRDVLEAAAYDVGISDMSDAEQAALQTFKDRLTELHELQDKRAEAGRLYKEQRFGANVDRQAAAQTLERMYELDKQIAAASRKVLGAENSKVLKPILQYVRKSVEKKERERSKAVLERWRDRRDNADAVKKYRARVEKSAKALIDMLSHPTKDAHVPYELQVPLQELLDSIDFTSKTQNRGGAPTIRDRAYTSALHSMRLAIAGQRTAIEGAENGAYSLDVPPEFLNVIDEHIQKINQSVKSYQAGTSRVYDMTSSELADLAYLLGTINKAIRDIDKPHMAGAKATALMDAWRDDDKYETFWEKYLQAFFGENSILDGNLFSEMNPLEKIIFVRDALSIIRGYDVMPGYANLFKQWYDFLTSARISAADTIFVLSFWRMWSGNT